MNEDTDDKDQRYRAPALEKGLDVLELISCADTPMTISTIANSLDRSTNELFRMVQVLEYRGYIAQAESGTGFIPTAKLFSLAMRHVPVRSLTEVALPIMRQLAEDSDQSCHLALRADGDIVIAARMESAGLIGFSVRVGYRMPIPLAGSGATLFAYQSEFTQERWEKLFDPSLPGVKLRAFKKRVQQVAKDGYGILPSEAVPGITDLSAPVLRGETAAAALTMPFVKKPNAKVDQTLGLQLVRDAARRISDNLIASDIRS